MVEFQTKKPELAILINGMVKVTFLGEKRLIKQIESLKEDKEYLVTIKEYSKKRSLSQNAYLWVLLDQMGDKLNISKEEVYKKYIKDYGVFEILAIQNKGVTEFAKKWEKNGLGYCCEELGDTKEKGYTRLIAYYGSSTYTSKEMNRLLEAIIFDCNELGINTLSLSEIMLLKNEND